MGWQCHPTPDEELKSVAVGAPRLHLGPPYYPWKKPVCLWQSFAMWPLSKGLSPPPPLPAPSSSSLGWGWGAGQVQLWEEEGEKGDCQEPGI